MMESRRLARLVALKERVRDVERARFEEAERELHARDEALLRAARAREAATEALRTMDDVIPADLELRARAVMERVQAEHAARSARTEQHTAVETRRHARVEAEREVKLLELAEDRARREEDVERGRREGRALDDRVASERSRT